MAKCQYSRHERRNQVEHDAQSEDQQEEGRVEQHLCRVCGRNTAGIYPFTEQMEDPFATAPGYEVSQCQTNQSAYEGKHHVFGQDLGNQTCIGRSVCLAHTEFAHSFVHA